MMSFHLSKMMIIYILFVTIGFIVRIGIISPIVMDAKHCIKKSCFLIVIVTIITLLWNLASKNIVSQNVWAVVILTFCYVAYILNQKSERDGYVHSFLTFINGYFITSLSFMSLPWNIVTAIITIVLAIFVFKKFENERKSVLIEIFILCAEAILISIIMWVMNWNNTFNIVLVVLFVETAVYALNFFLGIFCVWICGEDIDEYIIELKGLKDY